MRKNLLFMLAVAASIGTASAQIETKVPYGIGGGVRKAHQETKKIAIGYFGVAQTVQNSQSATAAGGAAYAKMTVNFGGVDINAYQAVVKEAYDLAVSKLKAMGYEVLTSEEIKATGIETYLPTNNPAPYKANSGTIQSINIQPAVNQVTMNMSPMGFLPFISKAKQLNANMINFTFGATSVAYDRGSRFSKKASVSASPWLTFGGSITSYPIGKGASPAMISVGYKGGVEDFAGPLGLYETSSNHMPWLGSNKGKYVLDIDQAKYLAALKTMLMEGVEKGLDHWNRELTK